MRRSFQIAYFCILTLGLSIIYSAQTQAQIIYAVDGGIPPQLLQIELANGGCTVTTIGPLSFPGAALDMAVCPDGSAYATDGSNLYSMDLTSGETTLIGSFNSGDFINSIGCDNGGVLYGCGTSLHEINTSTGMATFLGGLPSPAAGDIMYFNGNMYYYAFNGLYEIDLASPISSMLIIPGIGFYFGMAGYYGDCNTFIAGGAYGEFGLLNLDDMTDIPYDCSLAGTTVNGVGSLDDFTNPPCDSLSLDLDEDDNSGATEMDYNGDQVDCIVSSVNIADDDAIIFATAELTSMTVKITGILQDFPDEYLFLAGANNILIDGNGTSCLILTNTGTASVIDFIDALRNILYENIAFLPTPGVRTVEVFVTNANGKSTPIATALIEVTITVIEVDLGPPFISVCDDEIVTLNSGYPGLENEWSNSSNEVEIIAENPGLYSVTVTDANNGCYDADTIQIIHEAYTVLELLEDQIVCEGDFADLTITFDGPEPIDITISNNVDNSEIELFGIISGDVVPVSPNETTTYEISFASSDSISCFDFSMASTTLEVINPSLTFDVETICKGEVVFLGGSIQTEPGIYVDVYPDQYGCDSIVETELIVFRVDTTSNIEFSCNHADTGSTITVYQNVFGCDSTILTITEYVASEQIEIFITTCDSNDIGKDTMIFQSQSGCDSLVITQTEYSESDTVMLTFFVCDKEDAGIDSNVFVNINGCDSIVFTEFIYFGSDTTYLSGTSCSPSDTGQNIQQYLNSNGCDSVVSIYVLLVESQVTMLQASTCDSNVVGVDTAIYESSSGCDSLVITGYSLQNPDSTQITNFSCNSVDTGTFIELYENIEGCDSIVFRRINLLRVDTTWINGTSCILSETRSDTLFESNQFGCDSIVFIEIEFITSDTTIQFVYSCDFQDTTVVENIFENNQGCDSLVLTYEIFKGDSECMLNASAVADTIDCFVQNVSINISVDTAAFPIDYQWVNLTTGNNGSGEYLGPELTFSIGDFPEGEYTLILIDSRGLSDTLSLSIIRIHPPELSLSIQSDYNGYDVSCPGRFDGIVLAEVLHDSLTSFLLTWSNGENGLLNSNLDTGIISAIAEDNRGCKDSANVQLFAPEPIDFSIGEEGVNCETGVYQYSIQDLKGGVEPYGIFIDNELQDFELIFGLDSGLHSIVVQDENGCESDIDILVPNYESIEISLGPDLLVQAGDSVSIEIIHLQGTTSYTSIFWNDGICNGCEERIFVATDEIDIWVEVVDSNGCSAITYLTVRTESNNNVYIPNAFSPNADRINDNFQLYSSNQNIIIEEIKIFNRWGDKVFERENILISDLDQTWDGTFRNKPCESGVYVYYIVIQFEDGTKDVRKGEITLVR